MPQKDYTRSGAHVALAALLTLGAAAPAGAQGPSAPAQTRVTRANWPLAERFSTSALRTAVYSTAVQPRWIGKSDSLWYNWRDRTGSRFYVVIPPSAKRPLFDHVKMAAALSETRRRAYEPNNLPFTTLNFTKDHRKIRFTVDTTRYEWNLAAETLRSMGRPSRDTVPSDEERDAVVGQGGGGGGGGGAGAQQNQDFRNFSPDSTAFAFARNHNLFVVEVATKDTVQITTDGVKNYSYGFRDTTEVQQQQDQQQDDGEQRQSRSRDPRVRANVVWSPDSKAFAVTRNDARKVKELYLVNVLAEPRPTLRSYSYAMPGEENVAQVELSAFKRGDRALTPLNVRKWKDQRLLNIHWTTGSQKVRLVRRDRPQRTLEVIEVDIPTNTVTPLITEAVENQSLEVQPVRYVRRGGDIVWWSERSGWGHLYLYDHNGKYKGPLTQGAWRVDGVAEVDSVRGIVYLNGVGRENGENPYYRHLYRVNGDGSGFALVDAGPFNHTSQMSPSKRYIVDTYSRPDAVPKAVLRDATGRVVLPLEEMDVARLKEMGWRAPETFVVKAADGITDIYGNMWKPFDFDSTKKYPIVAHVYPGPQTESVNPGFAATPAAQQLAQLGFVVIQIGNRGGSPQRSNAYQNFGYYNLRDYALADKKSGIEQLAARHAFIDLDRVGIFGHSGGGFLTGAALLQPPYNDFFKVGVSSAGNHDNNIYNQNWSEQYHGLRIAQQKADSASRARGGRGAQRVQPDSMSAADSVRFEIKVPTNTELAGNLKGRLLLVHGDMDDNVHPGNTIRLVNALIKANKRFDFMIMPGKPHGFGDMQPYFNRMLLEYFAEHLMGDYYRAGAEIR